MWKSFNSAEVKSFVAYYGIIHIREPLVVPHQKPGDYQDHQIIILHGRGRTSGLADHQ